MRLEAFACNPKVLLGDRGASFPWDGLLVVLAFGWRVIAWRWAGRTSGRARPLTSTVLLALDVGDAGDVDLHPIRVALRRDGPEYRHLKSQSLLERLSPGVLLVPLVLDGDLACLMFSDTQIPHDRGL